MDLDVRGSQAILGPPNYRKLSFLQDSTKKNSKSYTMGPIKPRYLRTKTGDASERPNNPQIN
jgi:hypothetical protein